MNFLEIFEISNNGDRVSSLEYLESSDFHHALIKFDDWGRKEIFIYNKKGEKIKKGRSRIPKEFNDWFFVEYNSNIHFVEEVIKNNEL